MKPFLTIFFCALSLQALSQTVYLADTAFITDVGYGGARPVAGLRIWGITAGRWNVTLATCPQGFITTGCKQIQALRAGR